jgi:aminoglycoside phosphotransferase family enzyme
MPCANRSRNSGTEAEPGAADSESPPSFAEKCAFLESGAPWAGETRPEVIETHASLVFLTTDRAWKLKKPVRLVHVDQTTLEARERLCREEVRLNREMSGGLYRGLTPLVQRPDGALRLGGAGRIVDWLIETVRLPGAEMLDRRLTHGPAPGRPEIAAVGDTLVGFYRASKRPPGAGETFFARLVQDGRIAAEHLREMAPEVGLPVPESALDHGARALRRCRAEILDRARCGLLVEGHGDLRAEHVCLTDPPVLFDRLEIDSGLRIVDPFFEVGALGIECGLLGADWIGAQLLDGLDPAFPRPSPRLMMGYGLVACLTRARIAIDHFRDDIVPDPSKWRRRVEDYLHAATALTEAAPEP